MVVDSGVWIDFFDGAQTPEVDRLDHALGEQRIVVGDLILAEVLQGFRREDDFRAAHEALRQFDVVSMVGPLLALQAAQNYRRLRQCGVTVGNTIDVLIATFCIDNAQPLLFSDRDLQPFVDHLGLQSA